MTDDDVDALEIMREHVEKNKHLYAAMCSVDHVDDDDSDDTVQCAHCGEQVPESAAKAGPHGHAVHEQCSLEIEIEQLISKLNGWVYQCGRTGKHEKSQAFAEVKEELEELQQ